LEEIKSSTHEADGIADVDKPSDFVSTDEAAVDSVLLEKLKRLVTKAKGRRLTFLLVGRTGVGKSSTVNSLMGREEARVGKFRPTSTGVTAYEAEVEEIKYLVVDTPGFFDASGSTNGYIKLIRKEAKEIDCLWFVTRLDDNRVGDDEVRSIGLVTKAFGADVWKRSIIIFTHSDKIDISEYAEYLTERTKVVREVVADAIGDKRVARGIPSVAITNKSSSAPDGSLWLGQLYTTILSRISKHGAIPFILATARRVRERSSSRSRDDLSTDDRAAVGSYIELTPSQKREVRVAVSKHIDFGDTVALTLTGAGIGAAFGPIGAAIGGSVGLVCGLFAMLRD
jgi:GTP-binding protein EngB required for normal cell division